MLFARLVQTIEDHAQQLTVGVWNALQDNPRTPAYHIFPRRTFTIGSMRCAATSAVARSQDRRDDSSLLQRTEEEALARRDCPRELV